MQYKLHYTEYFRSQNSPSGYKSLRYIIVGGYHADEEGEKIHKGDETHGNKAGNGNGPCLVVRKVVIVCIETLSQKTNSGSKV